MRSAEPRSRDTVGSSRSVAKFVDCMRAWCVFASVRVTDPCLRHHARQVEERLQIEDDLQARHCTCTIGTVLQHGAPMLQRARLVATHPWLLIGGRPLPAARARVELDRVGRCV